MVIAKKREFRRTGGGNWGGRDCLGFANVARYATYMQFRRHPKTSPMTQLPSRVHLTVMAEKREVPGT